MWRHLVTDFIIKTPSNGRIQNYNTTYILVEIETKFARFCHLVVYLGTKWNLFVDKYFSCKIVFEKKSKCKRLNQIDKSGILVVCRQSRQRRQSSCCYSSLNNIYSRLLCRIGEATSLLCWDNFALLATANNFTAKKFNFSLCPLHFQHLANPT